MSTPFGDENLNVTLIKIRIEEVCDCEGPGRWAYGAINGNTVAVNKGGNWFHATVRVFDHCRCARIYDIDIAL